MRTILLKKWQGRLTAFLPGGGFGLSGTSPRHAPLGTIALGLCLLLLPVILALAVLAGVTGHLNPEFASAAPLAFALAGNTTVVGKKTRADLDKIIADVEAIDKKYDGKPMDEADGKKYHELMAEGESLSKQIEAAAAHEKSIKRMRGARSYLDEVPDPALPGAPTDEDRKALGSRIAGYLRLGDFLSMSPDFKDYAAKNFPKTSLAFALTLPGLLRVRGLDMKAGFIPIGREFREQIEKKEMETKDLPVYGSRVIQPDRLPDIAADTENDKLTMRDILNVVPTTSNTIEWIGKKDFTRAADVQSEGATVALTTEKPDADAEYELRSTNIITIAGHIPVSTQQLSDAPALVADIQNDLLYDVRKKEEEKVVWDDATNSLEFDGLDNTIDDDDANDLVGDSLIDKLRRRLTFVTLRRYEANAITIHPTDWEAIELQKGSDQHYIWAIIRDTLGARVWSLRVVESVAMQDPAGTTRIAIVGDWRRGATLFDRMQASIAIGMINADFVKNIRRILAEERVGFAVRRPGAFSKIVTESP